MNAISRTENMLLSIFKNIQVAFFVEIVLRWVLKIRFDSKKMNEFTSVKNLWEFTEPTLHV